ncbi:hypothetical protein ACP4OV_025987 [Aristida adscensionis]
MGGVHRRTSAAVLLCLLLLAAAAVAARRVVDDDGSRSMQTPRPLPTTTATAAPPAMRLFGYVPRQKLIPPSGPSEGHNAVGPEETIREERLAKHNKHKP